QLKSADICLLQRMIISNGLVELQNKKYPLDSASAALDIVDDVFDIFEDSKSMNGNLFTTFCDDFDRLKIVFDWFISPYKQKILYNLNTGDFPNYIREYLEKVVERIDNCRISLVNNTI
ncbi:MAG TPA: hypothetical protein PKK33_06730, partial [Candidatus Cloacimonadota bacterium]|nr:hypothetical protein [Candidatus Cloacimonadota bacterium]